MSILYNRRVLAFVTETTAGTPMNLTASNAMFAFDAMVQPDIPMAERAAFGTLGNLPAVPGVYKGKSSFKLELTGGGATAVEPAWASVLLPACGFVQNGHTYTPTSNPANYKTITLGLYEQGPSGQAVFKVLAGAMGNVKLSGETGKPVMLDFDFQGIWQSVVDATEIALPNFPAIPPRFASSAFSVGAFAPKISKFDLDMGNTVHVVENIVNVSGLQQAVVTERAPKGRIDPMAENVATWNVWSEHLTPTSQTMILTVGTGSGGTITLSAPSMQFTNVQEANRDKLVTTDLDYQLNESAGDDSIAITFS